MKPTTITRPTEAGRQQPQQAPHADADSTVVCVCCRARPGERDGELSLPGGASRKYRACASCFAAVSAGAIRLSLLRKLVTGASHLQLFIGPDDDGGDD